MTFSTIYFGIRKEYSNFVSLVPSRTAVSSSFLLRTSCSISFLRSSWFKLQASKASLTNSATPGLVEISSSSWNATKQLWERFSKRQLAQHPFLLLPLLVRCSLLSGLPTCAAAWEPDEPLPESAVLSQAGSLQSFSPIPDSASKMTDSRESPHVSAIGP